MNDVPVQLFVAAYQDENGAAKALKILKEAKGENVIGIRNAAIVRKDAKGQLHIKETAGLSGGKSAVLGGVTGAAIGLIAGPALLVPAAVGAVVGGLASKLRDSGFSDARLKTIGESLKPGSSALIAVVEHKWVATVEQALADASIDAAVFALGADIANQLEEGHQVAYSALASEQGFSAERLATGEDSVEAGKIVIDDSGLYGGHFYATNEGFVVEGIAVDAEGAEYVEAAAYEETGSGDQNATNVEAPKAA